MKHAIVEALLLGTLVTSCGAEEPINTDVDNGPANGSHNEQSDAGAAPERPELPWVACPRYTDGEGEAAECARLPMPLWRNENGKAEPDSPELDFFVKRLPAKEKVRAQLWMLAGGPGVAGSSLEWVALQTQKAHPDLEIYLPDHRGTGRSAPFDCKAAQERDIGDDFTLTDFYQACADEVTAEWGDDLSMMSVTEAAYDVTTAMAAAARADVPIFAWGGSYGCYWLHRVLQVGADLIDSAIFDSPLRPVGGLSDVDLMLESGAAGDALLEACAKDEECSARLGDDPLGKALEILDGGGDCEGLVAAGFDRVRTQYLLVETLIDNETRGLVPPLLYRLERCEDEDVAFILALWDHLANRPGPAEGDPFGHSFALLPLIHGSEIYTVPTTDQQVWDIGRTALFANVGYVLSSYQGWALWPRYPTDRWVGQWAETDANVLVLHGTFDATTPIQDAQELAAHFSGKHQYYFEIEHASHGAAYTSHEVADGLTCGTYILDQFLDDPTTRPEGDCASAAPPYEFTAKDELLTELLGHTDVWDNPPK